jgi:hypothetical protein
MGGRSLRRAGVVVVGLLAILGTAACSGDGDPPADTTTTVPPETTTTTEPPIEDGMQVDPLYYIPEVGQCFDRRSVVPEFEEKQVDVLLRLDCQLLHQYEIFGVVEYPLPEEGDIVWPGDDAVRDVARAQCSKQFDAYVGAPYETSQLEIGYVLPPEDNFTLNQLIGCYLYDPAHDRTAGTAQGAAR